MTEEISNQELESFDKQLPHEAKNLVDGKDLTYNLSNYVDKTIIRTILNITIKEKVIKWSDKFEKACKDGLTEDVKKN